MAQHNCYISIIVPVFNVEKYLRKCVDSIIQQSYTDWELLLVDDGSTDTSSQICDEYSEKDSRIKTIHVSNGGVSKARNIALDNANGEWIMFVDSDDWLHTDCLKTCTEEVSTNNLDLLQFSLVRVDEQQNVLYYLRNGTSVCSFPEYVEQEKYNLCAGGSLLKRSIIENKSLRFNTDLSLAEDQVFLTSYMKQCQRLKSIPDVMYNYLYIQERYTNKINSDKVLKSIKFLSEYKNHTKEFSTVFDRVIVDFFIKLLAFSDYPIKDLAHKYKRYCHKPEVQLRSHRLFVLGCNINTPLCMKTFRLLFKLKTCIYRVYTLEYQQCR